MSSVCHMCGNEDTDFDVLTADGRKRRCVICQQDAERVNSLEGSNPSSGWAVVAKHLGRSSKSLQFELQQLLLNSPEFRETVSGLLPGTDPVDRPRSLLSFKPHERIEICARRKNGETFQSIADDYETSFQNIQKIVTKQETDEYFAEMQRNREILKAVPERADETEPAKIDRKPT